MLLSNLFWITCFVVSQLAIHVYPLYASVYEIIIIDKKSSYSVVGFGRAVLIMESPLCLILGCFSIKKQINPSKSKSIFGWWLREVLSG